MVVLVEVQQQLLAVTQGFSLTRSNADVQILLGLCKVPKGLNKKYTSDSDHIQRMVEKGA